MLILILIFYLFYGSSGRSYSDFFVMESAIHKRISKIHDKDVPYKENNPTRL